VVIDPLTLEVIRLREFDRPPCLGMAIDQDIYPILRDFYFIAAPITERVREQLEARHNNEMCACYRQFGGNMQFRPELLKQVPVLRRAVA
jgi:hypothetical protein